jgi:hypothetical protein
MTELDVRQNGHMTTAQPATYAAAPVVESEVGRWALDVVEVHRVAQSLAKTSFVPQSMRGKPEEVTAAILAGRELGLEPMTALRSIDIIQGTPALRALTLRGLVQAAGHEIWVKEATETRAIVEGRRKGSEHVERSVWSMERATKLGLTGKENWKKQPGVMLIARATSEVARLVGADVLMGMPYSIEELDHGTDPDDAPTRPTTARRRRTVEPAPEVERPPLPEPRVEQVDTATGEIQVEDPPADALIDEPEGWR